jgi:formamidopyrimidine-DNA glycosylase
MPELAEVEYFRKCWDSGLGKRVTEVRCHPAARVFRGMKTKELTVALTGSRLLSSDAHGKQMIFRFENATLGVHLGMTGELRCEGYGFDPGKHDHLVLRQKTRTLVFSDPRLFGRLLFHQGPADPDWWTAQAPSVLSKEFSQATLAAFLLRRQRAPIKSILLMQQAFPGVGNWMADEILWQARISPTTLGGKIRDVGALWKTIRSVCRNALRIIGTDGSDPPTDWLFSHRWGRGGFCPRCGLDLERSPIGGRTTCWCPRCQER